MAKAIKAIVKVQLDGGQAKPSPPLGPALGQHGVPIMDFVRDFNAKTADKMGEKLPTVITIYEDRSFTYVVKSPPAAVLLMKAAGMTQGSSRPSKQKVARVTWDQCKQIADVKKEDLNARDPEAAAQIIAGTARSMGFIVDDHPANRDAQFTVITPAEFTKMQADNKRAAAKK
jgi:large subunit ribosomal protein L11